MYGIVYFTDFTVYKRQLQIVRESFYTDRPTTSAVLLGSFGPTWHLVGT